jgi:thiosulfate reductase cytochrome b subunit
MDSLGVLAAVLVWLLIVGAALMRAPGAGGRSLVGAWLALTAVTMFIEFVVFFVILHILLFGLGEGHPSWASSSPSSSCRRLPSPGP